jgi:hypothetical protein
VTAPITSARVRELSAKATGGEWWVMAYYLSTGTPDEKVFGYLVHDDEMPTGVIDEREAPAGQDSLSHDLDLIAALCSEPARDRIAKALDLLERVEAGDAVLVGAIADPAAVHANMLRGTIARISIRNCLHVHGVTAQEGWWDKTVGQVIDETEARQALGCTDGRS